MPPLGRRSPVMWPLRSAVSMRCCGLGGARIHPIGDRARHPLSGRHHPQAAPWAEPNLYANWPAFVGKDYPSPVQIVFGVADPTDPATAVVRSLIADFPDRDLALAINALPSRRQS